MCGAPLRTFPSRGAFPVSMSRISCRAEKDSLLLELTNVDLYKLYKTDQKTYILLIQNIARELCRRLRKAGERIAVLEDALHGAAGKSGHE